MAVSTSGSPRALRDVNAGSSIVAALEAAQRRRHAQGAWSVKAASGGASYRRGGVSRHEKVKQAAPHKAKLLRRRGAARVIPEAPGSGASGTDVPGEDLAERPDGWYWVAPDAHQEFGPFGSAALARADRDRYSEEAPGEGETVQEAASEIGIADWIDPETGLPAEGESPPHFEEP